MMHFNVVWKIVVEFLRTRAGEQTEARILSVEYPERVSIDDTKLVIEEQQAKLGENKHIAPTTIIPLASIRKLKVEEVVET